MVTIVVTSTINGTVLLHGRSSGEYRVVRWADSGLTEAFGWDWLYIALERKARIVQRYSSFVQHEVVSGCSCNETHALLIISKVTMFHWD